jgi:hypothetical protein
MKRAFLPLPAVGVLGVVLALNVSGGASAEVPCPPGITSPRYCTEPKPIVDTKHASHVTATAATLNGVVNPNGTVTRYHFEYGRTSKYGKKTSEVFLPGDSRKYHVSARITGLLPNRTYHFAIMASSSGGSAEGKDVTFRTAEECNGILPSMNVTPKTVNAKGRLTIRYKLCGSAKVVITIKGTNASSTMTFTNQEAGTHNVVRKAPSVKGSYDVTVKASESGRSQSRTESITVK